MRFVLCAALVYHLLALSLAARGLAGAASEMTAARWVLHEEPRRAAAAICSAAAAPEARGCRLTLAWRDHTGNFVDVCPALTRDRHGAGFRLPRYYRLAASCPWPRHLTALAQAPALTMTIFR